MFKLAELFVDIKARDQQFKGQLQETKQAVSAWGVAVGTAVGSLAAQAIAGAASAIGGFFASGVQGAVDLQETMSKVEAIFGGSASLITAQADEMAAKFGVVKQEYLDAASGFGAAFKGAGMATGDAAEMGDKIAKLGMDMASFGNASNAEVFTAISAALRGENDPIERFGVRLSAAKIEAEALRSGLARNKGEITDLAKSQAALNLIMKDTADQQGDLERTADGSANQWRRLQGSLSNISVELMGKLEPALNSLLRTGNEVFDSLAASIAGAEGFFASFVAAVESGVETIGFTWRNMGDIWELAQISAAETFGNITATASAFAQNAATIAAWIGRNWYQLLADGFNAAAALFTNFATNLGDLAAAVWKFFTDPTGGFDFEWTPLLEGFEATVEQLPDLVAPVWADMAEEREAVFARIGDREVERAGRIAAAVKAASKPDAAAAGDAADLGKFTSARLDASDYAFKLTASVLNGGDDTAKKALAAQEKTAKATAETAEALKRPRPAVVG